MKRDWIEACFALPHPAPRPPSRRLPTLMLGKTAKITHDFEVVEGPKKTGVSTTRLFIRELSGIRIPNDVSCCGKYLDDFVCMYLGQRNTPSLATHR